MLLRATAIVCLTGYQRFLSPHKGYACAYRVHTGRCSCSSFAKRAITRVGLWSWPTLQKLRFARCKQALLNLQANGQTNNNGKKKRAKESILSECIPTPKDCFLESLWCFPSACIGAATAPVSVAQSTTETVGNTASEATSDCSLNVCSCGD